MKVLMLGWELPPYNSGGLGAATYQLCRSLAKDDVDIDFILPYEAEHNIDFMNIEAAKPKGIISVERLGIAYDSYKYIMEDNTENVFDIYTQVKLYEDAAYKLALNKTFDIVHAHDWLTFRAALRIKETKKCPIILHFHSVETDRAGGKRGNPLIHEIEELALNLADRVIAVSQFTKDAIVRDYQIDPDKIEVVHNSINAYELLPLDEQNVYKYLTHMKSKGYKVVTNIGRLTIQKGISNLLRAFKKVIEFNPKTLLLIVGSGDQMHELVELSADLGIAKNVIFTDFQRGKNWRDAYSIGDIFVMPSVSEPFGLTPLESISYGTPVLISKQSGVSEILKNALVCDFWDIDEMVNKIVNVLSSDQLRDELSKNSLNEVLSLTWDNASKKVMKIYNNQFETVAA